MKVCYGVSFFTCAVTVISYRKIEWVFITQESLTIMMFYGKE